MINLNDLIKSANGQLFGEAAAQLFSEFVFDAADARPTTLFVALRTAQGDMHYDIPEAIRNGAAGILCNEPPNEDTTGITVVIVRDSIDALMLWSRFVLGRMGAKVIAVAGTASKSVTTHTLSLILEKRYTVFEGDPDTDGLLAIPLTVARIKPDTQFVVMKLSPTAANQMSEMVQACQPSVVIITGIDKLVSATFESRDQFIAEHVMLLNSLAPTDLAVLSFDDDTTRELARHTRARVRTVSIEHFGADLMATNVLIGSERTGFDLRSDQEREVGRWSPLLGRQHLTSALAALVTALELDIPLKDGVRVLSHVDYLPGRMRPLAGKQGALIVDDTYHATLSSTLTALHWLAEARSEGRRVTLVIGDLDNLGSSSAFAHRTIGAQAAATVDFLVTVGPEAALVGRSAIDTQMNARQIFTCYGVQDAISALSALDLTSEDVVLVLGGSNARMEQVVRGLLADSGNASLLVRQESSRYETVNYSLKPSWKEVSSDILGRNVQIVRASLNPEVTLMAVVKANGYGHGAVQTARTALANGAGYLGVANMVEALELRDAGITAPILVLTSVPVAAVRIAISQNITATVFDLEIARQFDRAARSAGGKLNVHVKIDTGMGRMGILADEAITAFRHLHAMNHLTMEGVYTHFASADDNEEFTRQQLDTFKPIVRSLKAGGFEIRYYHAANSPGSLLGEETYFNMIRAGVMLYGLQASKLVALPTGIQPAMAWKTTVLQVKTLPAGHSVGYGRTYITKVPETIAILPVGYADGLRRAPYAWKEVLIHGKRAPVIGRISMEKCAVNVSHIEGVAMGDEVVLLGRQNYDRISAEEVGVWLGTFNYEVTTTILPRG